MADPHKDLYGKSYASGVERHIVGIDSLEGLSEVSGASPVPPQSVEPRLADVQQEYQQLKIDAEQGR